MKKTLIALAVAGAVAAPAAFAATANVDVYGVLNVSYDYLDTDTNTALADKKLRRISSNSSRIGFKGSEDLGGGLSAIWQIEMGIAVDSAGNSNTAGAAVNAGATNHALRNTFVGLSSKQFGTVLAGTHDTPYKLATSKLDPFGDTTGDYNIAIGSANGTNAFELRANNVLAYVSPNFSGLTLSAAKVFGAEVSNGATGDFGAYSLSAVYDQGPFFASLAYEKHDNINGVAAVAAVTGSTVTCIDNTTGVISVDDTPPFACPVGTTRLSGTPTSAAVAATSGDDRSSWKAGVGYKFGATALGLVYERSSQTGNTATDRNTWAANVAHDMGNIRLLAAYYRMGDGDTAADTSANAYALGANYNLSKRTMAYGRYLKVNNDAGASYAYVGGQGPNATGAIAAGADTSTFSLGVRHSF